MASISFNDTRCYCPIINAQTPEEAPEVFHTYFISFGISNFHHHLTNGLELFSNRTHTSGSRSIFYIMFNGRSLTDQTLVLPDRSIAFLKNEIQMNGLARLVHGISEKICMIRHAADTEI
jgi:hypothetical protein